MAIFITAAVSSTRAAESIGVSVPTLDNVFWVRAVNFAKHTADTLGIELVVVGAENKEEKQLNDVQSLISRGVKALVITPQSTASAPGLIRLANRSNIPILIVDRYPGFPAKNDKAPCIAFIGPDDVTAGRDIANVLINKGATKIVAIGGLPGSSVAEGRQKGLNDAVAEAAGKGVKLIRYLGVGESEDRGYNAMQNLLAAHPSGTIDGVWCYNDALAVGAYRAIQQAGRSKEILIGGMDLTPDALNLIEKKTNFIYSTGGHWLQLGFGVMIAYDALHGHAPIKDDIRLSLIGVDSENFAKFKQQYIDNPPPFEVKDYMLTFNPKTTRQTFPLSVQ
jgi:simple sugar transport system substrate-binding protein/ribose transport system substrate-binding protein